MPIPTELVGSLPRPVCMYLPSTPFDFKFLSSFITDLQQAYTDFDPGKITREEFVKAQDKAVKDSLTRLKKTGETYLTDGDQRVIAWVYQYVYLLLVWGFGVGSLLYVPGDRVGTHYHRADHWILNVCLQDPWWKGIG